MSCCCRFKLGKSRSILQRYYKRPPSNPDHNHSGLQPLPSYRNHNHPCNTSSLCTPATPEGVHPHALSIMACAAPAAASPAAERLSSLASPLPPPTGIQMCTRPSLVPARHTSRLMRRMCCKQRQSYCGTKLHTLGQALRLTKGRVCYMRPAGGRTCEKLRVLFAVHQTRAVLQRNLGEKACDV